jgi:hypothetical protein
MPSRDAKDKVGQIVRFTHSEADQALLQAVSMALKDGAYDSFSALCKQALRSFLIPEDSSNASTAASASTQLASVDRVAALQQQITTMQIQMARLEGAIAMQKAMSLKALEQQMLQMEQQMVQQVAQLGDRLEQLESNIGADFPEHLGSEPEPPPIDPLLDRLVPLLEDF